jgi:hypothetical protein
MASSSREPLTGRGIIVSLLKLEDRYLNLDHITLAVVNEDGVEVVTPYEVLRLGGRDADTVLLALDRLATQTRRRLELPASA